MANFNADFVIVDLGVVAMPLPDSGTTGIDTSPPVLLISPEGGTLQRDDVVTIDVSDNRAVVVATVYAGDRVVYDGERFTSAYELSTIEYRENGWRLTIRYTLGWKAGPVPIEAMAIDARGNLRRATAMFEGTVPTPASCVNSVFGRFGPHVLAEEGDYRASQISNDSAVPGASVADAQNVLAADAMARVVVASDLEGTPLAPRVAGIHGRAVQDIVPSSGDVLTWSDTNNRWEPKAPAAAPATFWSVLYDKDLRTLPNQTISASMASTYINFTADGQPWCFHGSGGSLVIENGKGMIGNVNADRSSGNWYAGLHVCMKLYQMAGFDLTKETAVQIRYAITTTAIPAVTAWAGGEQWGYGPGDENTLLRWYGDTTDFQGASMGHYGTQPVAEPFDSLVLAMTQLPWTSTSVVQGDGKHNHRAGFIKRHVALGTWPSMESMVPVGGATIRNDITLNKPKMGWYAGSTSGTKPITVTHIRVLQRPVV